MVPASALRSASTCAVQCRMPVRASSSTSSAACTRSRHASIASSADELAAAGVGVGGALALPDGLAVAEEAGVDDVVVEPAVDTVAVEGPAPGRISAVS